MRNSKGNPSGETLTTAKGKLLCIAAPKAANAKELSLLSTKSEINKIVYHFFFIILTNKMKSNLYRIPQ